jgi:hypothetical protein
MSEANYTHGTDEEEALRLRNLNKLVNPSYLNFVQYRIPLMLRDNRWKSSIDTLYGKSAIFHRTSLEQTFGRL